MFSTRKRRQAFTGALAVGAIVALAGCTGGVVDSGGGGEGDEQTWNITEVSVAAPTSVMRPWHDWYLDQVEERTDGRITFTRTEPNEICGILDAGECLFDGRAQFLTQVPNYQPSSFASLSMPEIVFGSDNLAAASAAVYDVNKNNPDALAYLEEQGLHHVSTLPVGRVVIGTSQPAESVADLNGEAVRASGVLVTQDLEAVGASIVNVGAQEAYQAVQTGLATSVAGAMDFPVVFKIGELLPYWSDPGLGNYSEFSMFWDLDTWNEFPDDIKQTLTEIEEEINGGVGADLLYDASFEQCTALAEMANVESLTTWSEDATQEWYDMVGETNDENWVSLAGDHGLENADGVLTDYRAAVEKYEGEHPDYVDAVIECAESGFEEARS
ncbi:hypothetical protein GCM10011490_20820 [Pseudoclavibacter endophyticus]|uniref:TRAP transporter substrate-binding protein n=1 Tax=Pseudoclavibacter endophyticus TaxID=1778590 RepID=A0A6H9WNC9_9MICO|nr:hypothetical protein [Pseudoclavibacter endophyticus]KAB1648136.1 hypothetical protein F8O04_10470 [Pseudoclavibacter endophyticus]GGA70019.1 hypothetical protein GCM10011490_20820 [Pseudoclavibacter endophyticus]